MVRNASFSSRREVRTFVDLSHGADVLLAKSESGSEGNYFTTMGALLLTAFTFEAYLNHLGEHRLRFWSHLERLPVRKKYAVLSDALGITPDFSRRPYQTLGQLLKFRNALAHGRSEILEERDKRISARDDPEGHSPKTWCEEYCTLPNATLAKVDVEALIKEMHVRAGLGDHPFTSGMTELHVSVSNQGVGIHTAGKPDTR